jgi:hypothetical protein
LCTGSAADASERFFAYGVEAERRHIDRHGLSESEKSDDFVRQKEEKQKKTNRRATDDHLVL